MAEAEAEAVVACARADLSCTWHPRDLYQVLVTYVVTLVASVDYHSSSHHIPSSLSK